MILGFTGTSEGLTREQSFALRHLLLRHQPEEIHHGMCVGADEELHYIALALRRVRMLDTRIVGHPGVAKGGEPWKRSFCPGLDEEMKPRPFLARNQDIVEVATHMVAGPAQRQEQFRGSGTWATIRYTQKAAKPLDVIWPDGEITTWALAA